MKQVPLIRGIPVLICPLSVQLHPPMEVVVQWGGQRYLLLDLGPHPSVPPQRPQKNVIAPLWTGDTLLLLVQCDFLVSFKEPQANSAVIALL